MGVGMAEMMAGEHRGRGGGICRSGDGDGGGSFSSSPLSRLPDGSASRFLSWVCRYQAVAPGPMRFLISAAMVMKSLLYIGGVFGACLQEGDGQRVSKLLLERRGEI